MLHRTSLTRTPERISRQRDETTAGRFPRSAEFVRGVRRSCRIRRRGSRSTNPSLHLCKFQFQLRSAVGQREQYALPPLQAWVHEGGIATPLIAHWPAGLKGAGKITHQPGHLIDIMATCLDVAGTPYPSTYQGRPVTPIEGRCLLPVIQGPTSCGSSALVLGT